MFADDVAIITYSKEDTQKFINCLDKICRKFGMEISGTKTEIMHQKKRNDTYPSPKFYLGNHELKLVSNFKYLGTIFSTITSENASNYMESDINRRINQSWFAFSKFKNPTVISVPAGALASAIPFTSRMITLFSSHRFLK